MTFPGSGCALTPTIDDIETPASATTTPPAATSRIHRSNQTRSPSSRASHIYTPRPRSPCASSSTSPRRTVLRTCPYPFSEFSLLFDDASHEAPLSTALCGGSVLSKTSALLYHEAAHACTRRRVHHGRLRRAGRALRPRAWCCAVPARTHAVYLDQCASPVPSSRIAC
jgi:hypothetical protein